jgi:hypothetical protein
VQAFLRRSIPFQGMWSIAQLSLLRRFSWKFFRRFSLIRPSTITQISSVLSVQRLSGVLKFVAP